MAKKKASKTATAKKKTVSKKAKSTKKKAATKKAKRATGAKKQPNMTPPRAVQAALKKGLELRKDYGGKGLVPNTITWARKLAGGAPITAAKARKMNAYFSRHKVDRKPGWENPPTPGYVAWLLWGGDAARTWSAKLVEKLDAAEN